MDQAFRRAVSRFRPGRAAKPRKAPHRLVSVDTPKTLRQVEAREGFLIPNKALIDDI
jgi:hypothetical protein